MTENSGEIDESRLANEECDPLEIQTNTNELKVGYVYSRELIKECDRVPNLPGRASMVHSLIDSSGLLEKLLLINCKQVNENILCGFHSLDYLNCVKEAAEDEEFGLGYDCPPMENLYNFMQVIGGGSVSAAHALVSGQVDIAINFCGGWHHAQRDHASGFCYVNDIVLAILELQKKFKKVLYIDLDVHHGDGVENAFAYSKKVFTLSLHKCEEGFFPGTGSLKDIGLGKGRGFACNIPLKDGTRDDTFVNLFRTVCSKIVERFCPEVIVCQSGADSLAEDPLGTFNLTLDAYIVSVSYLKSLGLPLLVLGGGGYKLSNAARCFVAIVATLLGCPLPQEIPEHDTYFDRYGPAFDLEISASNRRDENSPDYIQSVLNYILGNLEFVE